MAESKSKGFRFLPKGGKGMLFLTCFFIASVIWIVNALSKTYVTDMQFQLLPSVKPEKNAVPVKVTLKGQGFTLLRVFLRINNNSYSYNPLYNTNCIEITDSLLGKMRNEISLSNVKPAVIPGSISYGQSNKKVAVRSRVDYSFAPRFGSISGILIRPDSIEIAGPENIIDTLNNIYTSELQLGPLNKPYFGSVALRSPSTECWIQQDKIWIYIPAEEFTEAVFEVPVTISENNARIQVIPEKVKVFCQIPVSRYNDVQGSMFSVIPGNMDQSDKTPVRILRYPSVAKNIRTEPRVITLLKFEK